MEISIIVPVYNRGYCLRQCLDSILYQRFTDWECILIDDGSTDNSFAICQEYAANDVRFRAYHQENAGVSVARNKGLDMVNGVFVSFVDSDDCIENDCLQALYVALGDHDWVIGGMKSFSDGRLVNEYTFKTMTFLLEPRYENEFVNLEKSGLLYGPCCKLYKYSIIKENKIRFLPDISYGEDRIFNSTYLLFVRSFHVLNDCLYTVIVTPYSLSSPSSYYSFETVDAIWKSRLKFYTDRSICGASILLYGKRYYCCLLWACLAKVLYQHKSLSAGGRYRFIQEVVTRMDHTQMEGALCSFWRRFLMKRAALVWSFFELKYVLIQLSILKKG